MTQFVGFRQMFFEDEVPPEDETEDAVAPENIPDDVEPEAPDA
jgi:hypothetical protein